MKRDNNKVEKFVSKIAYATAKSNVNSNCMMFFYQPTLPEKVKALKKK